MKQIFIFLISSFILSYSTANEVIRITGHALGTYYAISYTGTENKRLPQEIDSLLTKFSLEFSIFETNSLVSKINRNEQVTLSSDFLSIFPIVKTVSKNTGGAFDITVAPLVNIWGFGKEKHSTPSKKQIDSILQFVGYNKISLENNRLVKQDNRIQLNFNAIAKGYAVDKVSDFLMSKGYRNFIVDIGGELILKGSKNGESWKMGIQKPTENKDDDFESIAIIEVKDKAVATSGNYRNYIEENGKRVAHTINPITGYPEIQNLLSVTVIAETCCLADAYATAFMVMGLEKSLDFLKTHPELSAFFIYDDHGSLKTTQTENFPKVLKR